MAKNRSIGWTIGSLLFSIQIIALQAQTYTCSVQNQTVIGTDMYFDIYLQNTSSTDTIYLGDTDFSFTFDNLNFTNDAVSVEQFGDPNSKLDWFYGYDAVIPNTPPYPDVIKLNISPPFFSNQTQFQQRVQDFPTNQTSPGTFIATIKVSQISNPNGSMNLLWRSLTPHPTIVQTFETVNYNQINITSNGIFQNPPNTPLPVELTSFTARRYLSHVQLHWETATELNNYGFEVQRKEVGYDWDVIGFVPGKGSVLYPQVYDFRDNLVDSRHPHEQIAYRLRQIDRDGTHEFSPMVHVASRSLPEHHRLHVYPNPGLSQSSVALNLDSEQTTSICVYSALGREVLRIVDARVLSAGNHVFPLDLSTMPAGRYIVTAIAGGRRYIAPLMVGR